MPLSIIEGLSALRFTSALSFAAVLYLSFVVVINFFSMRGDAIIERLSETPAIIYNVRGIIEAFVIIMLTFGVQLNVLGIFKELTNPSVSSGRSFLAEGYSYVTILYTVIAVFGYATFSIEYSIDAFPSIILQADYGTHNSSIVFAYLTVCSSVTMASPLILHPVLETIFLKVFGDKHQSSTKRTLTASGNEHSALIGIAYLLAIIAPDLIFIFSVMGSLVNPLVDAS